jgi:tetratricopeptide (TPR) repeat protein
MSLHVEPDLDQLGRASRRAAAVSLLGFIFVLIAIGYAYVQLHKLEDSRTRLEAEQRLLLQQTKDYKDRLHVVQSQLSTSRAALASARAAINAFHSGDLKEALNLYDEALGSDPDNAYLQNLRAYTLFRLHRVQDAINGERRSVAIDPNYAWGYFDLARFLCANAPSDLAEAQNAAQRAIALRPDIRAIMENDGEFQRVCRNAVPRR